MNTSKAKDKKKVVVVGTGDKARGLAHMYQVHAKKEGWFELVYTEPILAKNVEPFDEYVSVGVYPETLMTADIVILCIPSYAMNSFLVQNLSILKRDCILVDLADSSTINDKKGLKGTLDDLGIRSNRWVKWSLHEDRLVTNVYGPDAECVNEVVALAQALGYGATVLPLDQGLDWEWKHATGLLVAIFLLIFTYITIQVSGQPNFEWTSLLVRHSNRMFAWTAIYGFVLSLLPGTSRRLLKQLKYPRPTPRVIEWGCNIQAHVGLLSLYFLFLHACLTLLMFGDEYFGFMFRGKRGKMDWEDEASMITAALSTSLFIITGIASLPSVSHAMNKVQFAIIFGKVVWCALALGTAHVMFLGVSSWTSEPRNPYVWTRGMPPTTLLASVLPLFAMFIKTLQVCMALIAAVNKKVRVPATVVPNDGDQNNGSNHLFRTEDDIA